MPARSYVWLNGQCYPADQPVLTPGNRAFAYGDGLFETIHAFGTQARHLPFHFERLARGMALLGIDSPVGFSPELLGREITRLLNRNKLFASARVRVTVFRGEGGSYTPSSSKAEVLIQSAPLPQKFYSPNPKGVTIDLFTELRKPINPLANVKSCNALLFVMAGIHRQRLGLDDCLLINDQNRIAEATASNVFVLLGNELHTPALSEGCVAGVMRRIAMGQAEGMGLRVNDGGGIEPHMLSRADEILLTNAIVGVQWVLGFRQRRYFGEVGRELLRRLNRFTFPDQFNEGFSG